MKTIIYTENYKAYEDYPEKDFLSIVDRKTGTVLMTINQNEFGYDFSPKLIQAAISQIENFKSKV